MAWQMEGEEWKDDDGCPTAGGVPFGRAAREWFTLRIAQVMPADAFKAEADTLRGPVTAWFSARAEDFVLWLPTEHYRGEGYNAGAWELNLPAIVAALPTAFRHVRSAVERAKPPHLPVPDIDAALAELALVPVTPTKEPSAWNVFLGGTGAPRDEAGCDRFSKMRGRVQRSLEVRCPCCDAWWYPRALGLVRCPACRKARRQKCTACHQHFTTEHGKQKRCQACRAAATAAD